MPTRHTGEPLPASWRLHSTQASGTSPGLDLANQPPVSQSCRDYKLVPAPRRPYNPRDQGTRPVSLPCITCTVLKVPPR